jgi:hypothetical protein
VAAKVIQNEEVGAFLVSAPLYQETLVDGADIEEMGEAP